MNETIAAVATAYGEGGIGIIRISGELAEHILNTIFVPAYDAKNSKESRDSAQKNNRVLRYGNIVDPDTSETIDEVLAVFMKAPATYTREDVAEIHCHGSVVALHKTLSLCLRLGASPAEPGEFTKRAFLNGRLDLTQAEAVIDMIRAKTTRSFEVAVDQLKGRLSVEIETLRKHLLDILVEMTVNIDYPDEDIEEIIYENLTNSLSQIGGEIDKLRLTADSGRVLQEGLDVAIIGKPNVGKSSLMNALMRETRAIVTEIPGTTRDTISETLSIKGIPVRLTDTAGIRDTDDTIEQIGIAKSKESFRRADLILMMLDVSEELSEEDKYIIEHIEGKPTILLANKTDLGAKATLDEIRHFLPGVKMIETSMVADVGLEEIEHEIQQLVYGGKVIQNDSVVITNARHENLLREAGLSIQNAANMAKEDEPLELIEVEVRRGYELLGEIIGETVAEDIIDEVFARFCLGK